MNASNPLESFESFGTSIGLSPRLLPLLSSLKIETPTPVQTQGLPPALEGRDLVAIAQTGSGKTLVYALALLTHLEKNPEARGLVLLPSRETADQVHRVILTLTKDTDFRVCLVASGVPQKELASALKKNPRLLIATPGRLNEFLQTNKLLLKGLTHLVLDEADRMLEMGFEPQLQFMQSTLRGTRQTLLFAATFGPKAQALVKTFVGKDAVILRTERSEKPVDTLHQKVYFLSKAQKENRLMDELAKLNGSTILFADSQESCVALGRLLQHREFSCEFVHGDMNSGHRTRVLREFREERFQILITTDLLARGLDVDHVLHVINYDLPYKADDYLHRIGRTARAGREGSALTFITPSDGTAYRKIRRFLEGAEEETLATNFQFYEASEPKNEPKKELKDSVSRPSSQPTVSRPRPKPRR